MSTNKSYSSAVSESFLNRNYFANDPEFTKLIRQVEEAIEAGVYPERIVQGSSGSYFTKTIQGECIGVFKPKNEEPYGPKNPKWTKWCQKMCCPCCFGRGCLLANQGYLSEAGATVVDEKLGLMVVPKTKVVWLAAPTFNYSSVDRAKAESKAKIAVGCPKIARRFHRIGLPPKIGSLQTFVKGYKDATTLLTQYDLDNAPETIKKDFQLQFERLVCLDYIIRNTDRGSDNWLIKIEEPESPTIVSNSENPKLQGTLSQDQNGLKASLRSSRSQRGQSSGTVKIAAIDNGLAFPFKHPDEWRTYPFGWVSLKQAKQPFSEETRNLLRNRLENINFIEELCNELKSLFKLDKEFNLTTFEKQMSVMRGQILNLNRVLKDRKSPWDLVQMQPMVVVHSSGKTPSRKKKSRWSSYIKSDLKVQPVFKNF